MMSEPCRCRFIGHIADLSALVGIKLCKPRDISCVFPCHPVTLLVILSEAKDLAADRRFFLPYHIHMRHRSGESTPESSESSASFGHTLAPGSSALYAIAMAPAHVSSTVKASNSSFVKKRASSISSRLGLSSLMEESNFARNIKK